MIKSTEDCNNVIVTGGDHFSRFIADGIFPRDYSGTVANKRILLIKGAVFITEEMSVGMRVLFN
jgi:hypothetical protein